MFCTTILSLNSVLSAVVMIRGVSMFGYKNAEQKIMDYWFVMAKIEKK